MKKRIAFFGTPDFTTDFLDVLVAHDLKPDLIVTNPDRPSGRGMVMTAPGPKTWALSYDVPVLQPERIDESFMEAMRKEPWDLFIVIAYGKILPESLIELPTYGTINVHYSLLPQYRGATPVESAILHGDTTTAVVIQSMRYKLDTGPILAQKEISITPEDTSHTLRHKLNQEALLMLPHTLTGIFEETIAAIPQHESDATYTKKITKEDGEIDLNDSGIINYRKYKAYDGWPGIFFYIEKQGKKIRMKITKASYHDETFVIEEVIPENGKRQSYEDFLHSLH